MKKLGFGKKKEDGDSGRDALFASKRGPSSSSNDANPYAVSAASNDPYMNSNNSGPPPPPYSGGGSGGSYRDEKTPVPAGGYGGAPNRFGARPNENRFGAPPQPDRFGGPSPPQQDRFGGPSPPQQDRFGGPSPPQQDRFGGPSPPQQDRFGGPSPQPDNRFGAPPRQENRFGAPPSGSDRYGPGNYGNSGGFGENRYGDNGSQSGSRYGSGGYGNFGNSGPPVNSAARDELFSGAKPPGMAPPMGGPGVPGQGGPANDWESGRGENYGSGNYGAYQDRQLTAEEQEEEDIQSTKQEIRFLKQQDVASTRNALRIAAQAEETGRQTLERLGAQGESIHNTERNLDLASNQNRLAATKARELKTLNRSMFAVHVANPFTSGKRIAEREQRVLDDASRDRQEREDLRSAAWGNASRQNEYGKEMNKLGGIQTKTKANLTERSKYQFEADSDDEQMEDEIDNNLDLLHGAAKRMNHLAGAMGREVEIQNQHLDRIGGKVDRVDDEIALNRSRLDRIK